MNNQAAERPTFEPTEQNVMSIIELVWAMEKTTNKSKEEVIKKYTQGWCNTLSGLIQYFIPESQVAFMVTFEPNGFEYRAYHFMIKLPKEKDGKGTKEEHFDYFDINGKTTEDNIKPYCAELLNNVTPEEVFIGPGNYGISKRPPTSDPVINKCIELITEYPNVIKNGLAKDGPVRK